MSKSEHIPRSYDDAWAAYQLNRTRMVALHASFLVDPVTHAVDYAAALSRERELWRTMVSARKDS